jgi:hypothetical protein
LLTLMMPFVTCFLLGHELWTPDCISSMTLDYALKLQFVSQLPPGILPVVYSHWRLISFTYLLLWQGLRLISVLNSISSPDWYVYIFYIQVTNDLNTPIIHTPIIHLYVLICLNIIMIFFIEPNIFIV